MDIFVFDITVKNFNVEMLPFYSRDRIKVIFNTTHTVCLLITVRTVTDGRIRVYTSIGRPTHPGVTSMLFISELLFQKAEFSHRHILTQN